MQNKLRAAKRYQHQIRLERTQPRQDQDGAASCVVPRSREFVTVASLEPLPPSDRMPAAGRSDHVAGGHPEMKMESHDPRWKKDVTAPGLLKNG